jgi:hypothetical protein
MRIPFQRSRSLFRSLTKVVCRTFPAIRTGLFSGLMLAMQAPAQSVSLPIAVNYNNGVANDPACASSANGTGHVICVIEINGQLSAVSVQANTGAFSTPALNSTSANTSGGTTTGPNNPLLLGIAGIIGNSSCASTADATGDVVCAYNANGSLMGVRFNVFANPQTRTIYAVQNLGISATLEAHASCAIGAPRFSTGPAVNPLALVANEGPQGDTICAVVNTNSELIGVAFNPASGRLATQDLAPVAPGLGGLVLDNPSCSDTADGTNQVICAFIEITNGNLEAIAFDPRPATLFKSAVQALYPGTLFNGNLGCATPMDNSGQVICAATAPFGGASKLSNLKGFAFNPRTAFQSTLLQISPATAVRGTPSCSGLHDGSHAVICAVVSSLNIVNSVKFDPRVAGVNSGLLNSGVTASSNTTDASDLSCTFQNVNPGQVSCDGVLPSQNDLFSIILGAPNNLSAIPANPTVTTTGSINRYFAGTPFLVSWTAASGATSYKLLAATGLATVGLGANPLVVIGTFAAGTLSQRVTEPSAGFYSFQVQACNASGCDTGSNIASVRVQ